MREMNFFTTLPLGWQIFIAIVIVLFIVIMTMLIRASKEASANEPKEGIIIKDCTVFIPSRLHMEDEAGLVELDDEHSPENLDFEETMARLKIRKEIENGLFQ